MADSQAGQGTYQRSLKDHFCSDLSKHRSQHEEISGKARMKKLTSTPPERQVHERRGKNELSWIEREYEQTITKCSVGSWLGS